MVFCSDPQGGFTYAQSCWGLAAREQHPFELTKAKYWIRSCALFYFMRIQYFIGITMLIGHEPACGQFLPRNNPDSDYAHPPD